MDEAPEVPLSERKNLSRASVISARVVWIMLLVLGAAWLIFLYQWFIAPRDPAVFHRGEILTPVVKPTGYGVAARSTGTVRMRAWVTSPLDPRCLVSTQYFVEYSDGSMTKAPGMRLTTQGEVKESVYEASVPLGSPGGRARFFVRDTYNCGILARAVESPHLYFHVVATPPDPSIALEGTSE